MNAGATRRLLVRAVPLILNVLIFRHEIFRCGILSNNRFSLYRAARLLSSLPHVGYRPFRRDNSFEKFTDNETRRAKRKIAKENLLGRRRTNAKKPFRRVILKPFVGQMLLGHLSPDVPARKDSPSDWS